MSNVELKPCPVCGATKGLYVIEDNKNFEWYMFCDNCKTSLHNEHAETMGKAIEILNERYERTCHLISSEWGAPFEKQYTNYNCSECGHTVDVVQKFVEFTPPKFCKYCGAKIEH